MKRIAFIVGLGTIGQLVFGASVAYACSWAQQCYWNWYTWSWQCYWVCQ